MRITPVEATIYCEYRPELSGYERVGILPETTGTPISTARTLEAGTVTRWTYDSRDGRVQAAVVVDA